MDPDDLLTLINVTGDESQAFEFAVVRFYGNVGSNAPVVGFTAVKSFVKRARMWLDDSDAGRYQC